MSVSTLMSRDELKAVVRATPCFTSDDLAELLAGAPTRAGIARMRDHGMLVALRIARIGYLYPSFQVDVERHRVDPVVAHVNKRLKAVHGPDDAIAWWFTPLPDDPAATPAGLIAQGRLEEIRAHFEGMA